MKDMACDEIYKPHPLICEKNSCWMCSLEKFAGGGALCVGDHDWDDSMGKAQRQGLG